MTIRLAVVPDPLVFPRDDGYVVEPTYQVTPGQTYQYRIGSGSGGAYGLWKCPPGVTSVRVEVFGSAGFNTYPTRNVGP